MWCNSDRGASGQLADRFFTWGPLGSLLTSISVLSLAGKRGPEFSGGQIIQGAEAAAQLGVAQAALAEEHAQMLFGRALPFLRVAIETARDEVAVGIAAALRLRHNMV